MIELQEPTVGLMDLIKSLLINKGLRIGFLLLIYVIAVIVEKKQVGNTEIMIPTSAPKSTLSNYEKMKQRKRFRKRAGIEGVIEHLKVNHRLGRNFLSGFLGDEINLLMAAAAFNFRK